MNKIALISLSNGLNEGQKENISLLEDELKKLNLEVVKSTCLFTNDNGVTYDKKERARELMCLYKDQSIQCIFDVSGGDLANEVLDYLDFSIIKKNYKPFYGYSDLSVILNSLYSKTKSKNYLYQIRNIISDKSEESLKLFSNYIINNDPSIFQFNFKWVRGNSMEGILLGGNIRCTLKLAGTPFMPSFRNKIILLESLGGDENKIATFLTQLKLMGVFRQCNGIVLGTFTELQEKYDSKFVEDLVLNIVDNPTLPIIKTEEIGHSSTSKAVAIGNYYKF